MSSTVLRTIARQVLVEDAAKNRGWMSRTFGHTDVTGTVVVRRGTNSPQYVVSATSPDGFYLLLEPRTAADAAEAVRSVPKGNASPAEIEQRARNLFPVESSDWNDYDSIPKERHAATWEGDMRAIGRDPLGTHVIVHRLDVSSSFTDSAGRQTTAIGKALNTDAVDVLLDLTGLAADITGLTFLSSAIGSAQVSGKIAKGDWFGLLMDIIGLVPAVGEAVEASGKTIVSWIKSAPQAIPEAVITAFREALEKVASFLSKKGLDEAAKSAVDGAVKIASAAKSVADAASTAYSKHGVVGAVAAIISRLVGAGRIKEIINSVSAALHDMISKLARMAPGAPGTTAKQDPRQAYASSPRVKVTAVPPSATRSRAPT